MQTIKIEQTTSPKAKPAADATLGFGQIFTDHMFIMDYTNGAWHDPRIVPYAPIPLDPSASCFHYGQEVFEGMKAYHCANGKTLLFRPEQNFIRLNDSNERMCIPKIDVDFAVDAVAKLVNIDNDWIPTGEGTSLYVRPFIIGCDPFLGVHPASHYKFIIILSPVGAYYASGLNPIKIFVEPSYVRAVRGGTGAAKTGGNYASSMKAQQDAVGFSQVLWLDGVERKYVEEVGAMNVFFVIGDEVITPELQGSVLPGITRKSSVEILKSWGLKVVERRISIDEVVAAAADGSLKEMFGTGTAAVISPVGGLTYKGNNIVINDNKIGDISMRLYNEMTSIQLGKIEDKFNWTKEI